MLKIPVKFVVGTIAGIVLLGVPLAIAQIPTPKVIPAEKQAAPEAATPQTVPANTAEPRIQDFGKPANNDVGAVEDLNDYRQTPETIAESMRARQVVRDEEAAAGGFKWQSWQDAGPKMEAFVLERVPYLEWMLKDPTKSPYFDYAVADLDRDNEPDVIMYYWGDCGTIGCTINVMYNSKSKKPKVYYGFKIRPHLKGIKLDDRLYFRS